jgi:hypothetical protein
MFTDDKPDPVDTVLEKLKAKLYSWAELLSFEEIRTNPQLVTAIEELEETFAQEYGVRFRS